MEDQDKQFFEFVSDCQEEMVRAAMSDLLYDLADMFDEMKTDEDHD